MKSTDNDNPTISMSAVFLYEKVHGVMSKLSFAGHKPVGDIPREK